MSRNEALEVSLGVLALCVAACGDPSSSDGPGTGGTDGSSSGGASTTTSGDDSGTATTDDGSSSDGADTTGEETEGNDEHAGLCALVGSLTPEIDGYAVPGVSGAPRWGIPDVAPMDLRVRRSWSSLSDEDKQEFVDALLALKAVTVDSGDPGSSRADYVSLCEVGGREPYTRNLYDYYVEAHMNAFLSMKSPLMTMEQMPHKAPQFLVWHRYLLLRLEADLREVSGNPDFALPYWDWTDCWEDGDPTTCTPLFEPDFLGTSGSCRAGSQDVEGYLTDQGFAVHLVTEAGPQAFRIEGLRCQTRPLRRAVSCSEAVVGPPDAEAVMGIFDRAVYDAPPYDACFTEEDVSFRQYLEGFDNESTEFICVAAGCGVHGRGHEWIGGDMTNTATPNDPMFFLHHANVDRMWAAWQEANMASGDPARMIDAGNPGYPEDYRGPLFNWEQVEATEMFDYRALGYAFDELPTP